MNKKIKRTVVILIILLPIILIFAMFAKKKEKPEGLLDRIESYKGHIYVVSEEEYEFYKYFVARDLPREISEEELNELVKAYANEVNAAFYLGNALGLCDPYSFSALKFRMEQENASRQAKIADGEEIYGVKEFDLNIYFQYTMDNLQVSLMSYLEQNADAEILDMAKNYYHEHKDDFQYREEIVYEETIEGETKQVTVVPDTLSFLGKADPGLADFLASAEIGAVYEAVNNGQERKIVVKDITYSDDNYRHHADAALYQLVRGELYDTVIRIVARNNPVEFE